MATASAAVQVSVANALKQALRDNRGGLGRVRR